MTKRLSTVWTEVVRPFFLQHDRVQVAALCFREKRAGKEVLLITSRDTGRWIIPKGWPIDGLNASDAAAQEAWEEAGVRGNVNETPVGAFTYDKGLKDGSAVACKTTVYPVEVETLADEYPEVDERTRKWVSLTEAAQMVQEPELRKILEGF